MKTYEIQYIDRYYEEKVYQSEIIIANTKKEALISFAKLFGIKDYNLLFNPLFLWDNGHWKSSFKNINEIKNNKS